MPTATDSKKATGKKTTTSSKKSITSTKKSTTSAKKSTTSSKKTTSAKKPTIKKTTTKATTKKAATKKPATKKTTTVTKKIVSSKNDGIKIERKENEGNLLEILSVQPNDSSSTQTSTNKEDTKKSSTSKSTTNKTSKTSKTSSSKKTTTTKKTVQKPKTNHRTKLTTKEDKALYKRLEDAFNYVANLTMVIEEKTLDKEQIPDLTIGEIHVLEVVNKEDSRPMTKVANELKITVGSLTTCVNRLVQKDYLTRVRDDNDKRVMNISTTQKAKKVLKVHDAFHEEILMSVLDGVTLRDANKVMTQFSRVLENYYNPKEINYEQPIDKKKTGNI